MPSNNFRRRFSSPRSAFAAERPGSRLNLVYLDENDLRKDLWGDFAKVLAQSLSNILDAAENFIRRMQTCPFEEFFENEDTATSVSDVEVEESSDEEDEEDCIDDEYSEYSRSTTESSDSEEDEEDDSSSYTPGSSDDEEDDDYTEYTETEVSLEDDEG